MLWSEPDDALRVKPVEKLIAILQIIARIAYHVVELTGTLHFVQLCAKLLFEDPLLAARHFRIE